MNRIKNDRIQNFLQHIKLICDNILTNLFTLGNDLNTQTIMSVAYSPLNDIVYIYCADTDTGHILKQEIKRKFIEGEVKIHKINTDIVNNRYIIELEFRHKEVIEQNINEGKKEINLLSKYPIDNRHL